MKKRTVIALVALVAVLLGGLLIYRAQTRMRPLADVVPLADWTLADVQWWTDVGVTEPVVRVEPSEALADLFQTVTVKKAAKEQSLPTPCLMFFIQLENQETVELVVGANGRITYAQMRDLTGTRSYWQAADATLYQTLLTQLQMQGA